MKVSFCLTRADHAAYMEAVVDAATRQTSRGTVRFVFERIFLWLFFLGSLIFAWKQRSLESYASALFWSTSFALLTSFKWIGWRRWLHQHRFDTCMNIELRDDGVYARDSLTEAVTSWEGLGSIQEDDQHILLLRWGHSGLIIPKRAFYSPVEAEEFMRLATTYWQQAHGIQPVAPPPPIAAP